MQSCQSQRGEHQPGLRWARRAGSTLSDRQSGNGRRNFVDMGSRQRDGNVAVGGAKKKPPALSPAALREPCKHRGTAAWSADPGGASAQPGCRPNPYQPATLPPARAARSSSATMFVILIIGFTAGPAVSL